MNYTWRRILRLAAAIVLAILTGWFVRFWSWWHFGGSQRILGATRRWSDFLYALGEENVDAEARAAAAHKKAVEGLFRHTQRRHALPKGG